MRDKQRTKVRREIVNYMRRVNKQIANDGYLGLNRFRADIFSEKWERYSDGSGGCLTVVVKLTDKITGNSAYYVSDNYRFYRDMHECMNDFLIACSSGFHGCIPNPHYIAYDVHSIAPYTEKSVRRTSDEAVDTYNWTNYNLGF